jgi:hypothetical protein
LVEPAVPATEGVTHSRSCCFRLYSRTPDKILDICSPSTTASSHRIMQSSWGPHSAIANAEPLFDLSDDIDCSSVQVAAASPNRLHSRSANDHKMRDHKYEAPFSFAAILASTPLSCSRVLPSLIQSASIPATQQEYAEIASATYAEKSAVSFEEYTPSVPTPLESPLVKRYICISPQRECIVHTDLSARASRTPRKELTRPTNNLQSTSRFGSAAYQPVRRQQKPPLASLKTNNKRRRCMP